MGTRSLLECQKRIKEFEEAVRRPITEQERESICADVQFEEEHPDWWQRQ
jgi:hypothetical protein